MLLEWNGYSSEQRRQQTFSMIGIAMQHFPGTRLIALFYSQKLISTLRLERYLTKIAVLQHRCSTTVLLRWLRICNEIKYFLSKIEQKKILMIYTMKLIEIKL